MVIHNIVKNLPTKFVVFGAAGTGNTLYLLLKKRGLENRIQTPSMYMA